MENPGIPKRRPLSFWKAGWLGAIVWPVLTASSFGLLYLTHDEGPHGSALAVAGVLLSFSNIPNALVLGCIPQEFSPEWVSPYGVNAVPLLIASPIAGFMVGVVFLCVIKVMRHPLGWIRHLLDV
jgi:hypothetical protein